MSLFALAICLLAHAAPLLAQQTGAILVGTVADITGAMAPGVRITVRNTATNAAHETRTDWSGNYALPFLPAGTYTAGAAAQGFRPRIVTPFSLQVGQTARIDFRMTPDGVSDSISVGAPTAPLQTETAASGSVIDSAKLLDLPLNGRNFVQLAHLVPGVLPGTPGSVTVRRGRGSIGDTSRSFGTTAMSANGARDTNNRFYLDGIEFMDYDAYTYPFALSIDSLAEFKVETSTYSAEYGASPGGQVSIVTKSGTNEFQGTLWEFNRNDAATLTRDAIAAKNITTPRLNRNQFGANLGGPLRLPGLYNGANRTFFFFNWESGRLTQGAVPRYAVIPSTGSRTGDFRGLRNARTNAPITLKDPRDAGIAGNVIPRSALSPQALEFLKWVPEPNVGQGAFNFLSPPLAGVSAQDNYTTRVDHLLPRAGRLSVRHTINRTTEAGTPFWGSDQRNNAARTHGLASTLASSLSPRAVNEFRAGFSALSDAERFGTTDRPEFDVAGAMKIPLVSRRPRDFGPPAINLNGPDGVFSVFNLQRQVGPRDRGNRIFEFNNIVSMQRGGHFVRLGANLLHRGFHFEQARAPRGEFAFDGTYTGSALADFMLGYVRHAVINPDLTSASLRGVWHSAFIQDDWKVRPGFSFNLGVRYDYLQPFRDSRGSMLNIEQDGLFPRRMVSPGTSTFGPAMLRSDRNNFGPRIGFAWTPGFLPQTVFRAGYGIYFSPIHPSAALSMTESSQARTSYDVIGSPGPRPDVFFSNPFAGSASPGADLNAIPSYDQNYRDAYVQQWNFTIQRNLPGGFVLDAGYAGSKGTALSVALPNLNRPVELADPRDVRLSPIDDRRPNQDFRRPVNGDKPIGNSNYHSLQVRADRRMARGLTAMTSYTWAKCISGPSDIGADIGGGTFIGGIQDVYNLANERSLCGFDVRHRFVQTVIYHLPFFAGAGRVLRPILHGWQLSTITTLQSGFAGDIAYGVDTTATGAGSRPDLVGGQQADLPESERTWHRWFNTGAFALTPFGRFGTAPRTGAIRLPGLFNVDFSVNRQIRLSESRRVELRAEAFNLLHRYNIEPASLERNIRSVNFGKVGGGVQGIASRIIQLGAKLYF